MLEKISIKDSLWQSMAFSITKDKNEAKDLVQDMYLKVFEYNVSDSKCTDVFIYIVMSNIYKSNIRKSNRQYNKTICHEFNNVDDGKLNSSLDFVLNDAYFTELDDLELSVLNKAISLDESDKMLLKLNYNYSVREIAKIVDISYINVYRDLIEIRKKVLGDKFGDLYKNKRLKYKK